jgi:hypothetical protein
MTWKRKIQLGLFATALLAVAAAGSLFWFNWWIRNSWTQIYPLCHDGDALVEFTEPMTKEAFDLYARYMLLDSQAYVYVDGNLVFTKRWFWLFGDGELLQVTGLVYNGLAKGHGPKDRWEIDCSELAKKGTPSGDWTYTSSYYPPNWVRDNLQRISFDVLRERFGHYTPIGKFLKRFEITPDKLTP